MSLKEQGFRLIVDTSRNLAKWIHPAEPTPTGWIDCTMMNDEQFDNLLTNSGHKPECKLPERGTTQKIWEWHKLWIGRNWFSEAAQDAGRDESQSAH